MSRSVLKIVCIVSGILFVVFSIFTVYSAMLIFKTIAGAGIIGGAGAPTMAYVLQKVMKSPVFYAARVALSLFVGSGYLRYSMFKESEKST